MAKTDKTIDMEAAWRIGHPASSIWRARLQPEEKKRLAALSKLTLPQQLKALVEDTSEPETDKRQTLVGLLSASSDRHRERQQIEDRAKDRVSRALREGRLRLLGYRIPRSVEDKPVLIPTDMASRFNLDWAKGKLDGPGLEFVELRFLSEKQLFPDEEPTTVRIDPPKAKGRPGFGDAILAAHGTLVAKGAITPGMSINHQGEIVRAHLILSDSDGPWDENTPNKETLRKHLSTLIRRNKKQ